MYLSTFLDEEIMFECMNLYGTSGLSVWKQVIKNADIDIENRLFVINQRRYKLFQVRRQAVAT